MDTSVINSREDDKKSNLLLFRPPKRQFKDNLRLPRVSPKRKPLAKDHALFCKGLKEVKGDESKSTLSTVKFKLASLWEVLWLQSTLLKEKVLQDKDGSSSRMLLQELVHNSMNPFLRPPACDLATDFSQY